MNLIFHICYICYGGAGRYDRSGGRSSPKPVVWYWPKTKKVPHNVQKVKQVQHTFELNENNSTLVSNR